MKKKGFTLVELLAVIAILAILVIIALPNVLKMFRNAKQNTFANEIQNLVKTAENKYLSDSINNQVVNLCFDNRTNKLSMSGRSNIVYRIKLSNDGKIIEIAARDDEYELIALSETEIKKEEIGKKYAVSEAKSEILDCKGNALVVGEEVKSEYKESILNGADPVLGEKMIPVEIANDGKVKYADIYSKWYSYNDKKWANAVILVDNPNKKDYKAGDSIAESDIRAYFVWIPKYSYQIFNMGDYTNTESSPKVTPTTIKINFGVTTVEKDKEQCVTPIGSGNKGNCAVGEYMTHPAFISIPSNGFWVGKFEIGYNQNSDVAGPITTSGWTTAKAQVNSSKPANIIVKPDVYSWRGSTVYNSFLNAYNFDRALDSHMMKNTEWGAVVYLSHSKYGIGKEIRINNNGNYLTGYAANTANASSSTNSSDSSKWNTNIGFTASTTGNITGVYDMSGGASEYVAAYRDGSNISSSGMATLVTNGTYANYIEKYSSSSSTHTYNYRMLGDATGELGPFYSSNQSWYSDGASFIESSFPWFTRGGSTSNGYVAGQFTFGRNTGVAGNANSIRLILTPKN